MLGFVVSEKCVSNSETDSLI